jgi:plastocyanin
VEKLIANTNHSYYDNHRRTNTDHPALLKELPMRTPRCLLPIATWVACMTLLGSAHAADAEMLLVIRNHRFEPAELKIPAGQRIKLVVHNQDSTAEEFESHALNREKVIPGGAKATIYIGPLKAGRYGFFGEYNEATAKGVVVVE